MLKRLENTDICSASDYLGDDAVSLRIKSNLMAYKAEYPFAEFWAQYNESGEITAVLSKINGACTLTFSSCADTEELKALLHFIGFASLFLDKEKADDISLEYTSFGDILVFDRKLSENYEAESFCDMKSAFRLISENEGESVIKLDYLEWLSDFTFKSNRGFARLRAITDKKLVSFAMTSAETEKAALISGVFTDKNRRKLGYGEKALLSLAKSLTDEKKKVYIMTTQSIMTAYYEKRGFKKCGCWCELKGE